MTELDRSLVGAYPCAAHTGPNGSVIADQLSPAEFTLELALSLKASCEKKYPGKCDPNCDVAILIEKLKGFGVSPRH